jgi:hypothetical protein
MERIIEHSNLDLKQEKENLKKVEVLDLGEKGKGLVARRDFKIGEEVFVVNGETVNYATDYTIPLDEIYRVEPRLSKTVAQYMNHSCDPNIAPDQSNPRMYRAMRDVTVGEELVTNYGFLGYEFGQEMTIDGASKKEIDLVCKCGSKNCKGRMLGYKNMIPEDRQKYKKSVLPFLLDEEKHPFTPPTA